MQVFMSIFKKISSLPVPELKFVNESDYIKN